MFESLPVNHKHQLYLNHPLHFVSHCFPFSSHMWQLDLLTLKPAARRFSQYKMYYGHTAEQSLYTPGRRVYMQPAFLPAVMRYV